MSTSCTVSVVFALSGGPGGPARSITPGGCGGGSTYGARGLPAASRVVPVTSSVTSGALAVADAGIPTSLALSLEQAVEPGVTDVSVAAV